jgi:hypothetical protein
MKRAITARRHANPQQQSPFGRFSVTLLAFITDGIGGMVGNNSKNREELSILTRQSLAVSVKFCHTRELPAG